MTAQDKVSHFVCDTVFYPHTIPADRSYTTLAWQMLAPYSQQSFGSFSAFEAAEDALAKRTERRCQPGEATRNPGDLDRSKIGAGVWDDLTIHADMSRAYVVRVTFPGAGEPPQTFVVASLSSTGAWRVWVVGPPAVPSPSGS